MVARRKKDSIETKTTSSTRQLEATYSIVKKREQTQTVNVFLILACLSAGCRSITTPLECTLKIGPCEILSPYIFVAGVLLTSLLYHFSPSTPERTLVVPLISARCRREGNPLPLPSAHAYKNFGPLVFPSHF